jgi:hypothetical protein
MKISKKRPKGRLESIVTYFSSRKLVKLVYLADLYHYQLFAKRLTKVPFKHYYYGAWAPDIAEAVERLCDRGVLKEEVVSTGAGFPAAVPKPAVSQTTLRLPKTGFKALEMVVAEFGPADPDKVVEFTKKTLPFLDTPFGKQIDFSRSDPIAEYAKKHRISKREVATRDLILHKSLTKKVLEADKQLHEGVSLLTHDEVFSK